MNAPRALIAEDEPLLAAALARMLGDCWPELIVVATVGDGLAATKQAFEVGPDVLFLDIRMPGRSGLDVAAEVIDEWPEDRSVPLIVFVTAYDEFALAAFEREAVDFVLKPIVPARLIKTVERLKTRLAERSRRPAMGDLAQLLEQLQAVSVSPSSSIERLEILNVGLGDTVRMVHIKDVLFLEATDKYVTVVTSEREGLIRMSMRELLKRVDPAEFLQVHRGVVVNRKAIVAAIRDEAGRVMLELKGTPRRVAVSRAFSFHFRPM